MHEVFRNFYACADRDNLPHPHLRHAFELKLNLMALESALTVYLTTSYL